MSDEVQIETVLPRPADKRSRFNLGEINVAQSKDSHRAVERARLVLEREDDRGLVCAGWWLSGLCAFCEQKKARVVLTVILYFGSKHICFVDLGRFSAGNGGRARFPALHDQLDSSGSIVGCHRFDFGMS